MVNPVAILMETDRYAPLKKEIDRLNTAHVIRPVRQLNDAAVVGRRGQSNRRQSSDDAVAGAAEALQQNLMATRDFVCLFLQDKLALATTTELNYRGRDTRRNAQSRITAVNEPGKHLPSQPSGQIVQRAISEWLERNRRRTVLRGAGDAGVLQELVADYSPAAEIGCEG